jgi:predicted amidohydrolase
VGTVVGGTLVERDGLRYYNACHLFDSGRYAGVYRKMHPTPHERDIGISPGDKYAVFKVRGVRLAVLICADVLFPESFYSVAELEPEVIAIPTTSPFLSNDTAADKERRDRDIYIEGARITGAHIVKACGVGYLMGQRLQGRSLICHRDGIIAQVPILYEALEATLITEINLP